MWTQLASAGIGIWLMAAPAVLAFSGTAEQISRIAGPIIATFAFVAASECTRGLRLANVPVGLTLIAAPWFVFHPDGAWINSISCGIAVALLSMVRGRISHRFGGGWRVLWHGSGGQ